MAEIHFKIANLIIQIPFIMSTAKKTSRDAAPKPPKEDLVTRKKENNEEKGKVERDAGKSRRVNYVVKDLPIY